MNKFLDNKNVEMAIEKVKNIVPKEKKKYLICILSKCV